MDANKMTKAELEQWHVACGIVRWGESERGGLETQAAKKTLATLQYEHDSAAAANGEMTCKEMMTRAEARETGANQYQAAHCNVDGPT